MIFPKVDQASKQFLNAEDVRRGKFDPLADAGYQPDELPQDQRLATKDSRSPSTIDHSHNGTDAPPINLLHLIGMLEVVSAVPSGVPRSFWEATKLYSNGGTRRLYLYVTDSAGSGAWRYTALT